MIYQDRCHPSPSSQQTYRMSLNFLSLVESSLLQTEGILDRTALGMQSMLHLYPSINTLLWRKSPIQLRTVIYWAIPKSIEDKVFGLICTMLPSIFIYHHDIIFTFDRMFGFPIGSDCEAKDISPLLQEIGWNKSIVKVPMNLFKKQYGSE